MITTSEQEKVYYNKLERIDQHLQKARIFFRNGKQITAVPQKIKD